MGRPRKFPPEVAAARHDENRRRWAAARSLANQVYAPAARRTDAYRARLRIERDRQDERLGPLPGDAPRHPYAPQERPSGEPPELRTPKPARAPWVPHDPLWPVPQDPRGHGKPRRFPPEVSVLRAREKTRRRSAAITRAAQRGTTIEAERAALDAECGPLPGDEYPDPGLRPIVIHKQRAEHLRLDPRTDAMWSRFADDGLNFAEIASEFGLSRERVRQVIVLAYGQAMIDLVRFRNEARARLRRWVDTAESMRPPWCDVCGEWCSPNSMHGARWNFCPVHGGNNIRGAIMLMCDDERHRKHAALTLAAARRHGRLKGTRRPADEINKQRRRWLTPGSGMHALCTEAYAKEWPLLAHLPEQILEQLAREYDDEERVSA